MDLSVSVLSSIVRVLEKQSIKYVVVGSSASSIHGMYRATADIDLLVDITSLDERYLQTWAKTLGVSDLLAKLFLEAKS